MNKQISFRTYLLTILAIVTVALSSIAYVRSTNYIQDQTNLYLNPPYVASSYVIAPYNATWYVAKNGTNGNYDYLDDDCGAIVNAILAEGHGNSIEFTAGSFTFTTGIAATNPADFSIKGEGAYTTTLQLAANLGATTDFISFTVTTWNHGRFTIRDLHVDGGCTVAGGYRTNRHGIYIEGGDKWFIQNVYVSWVWGDGIHLEGGTDKNTYGIVQNCFVKYAGRYGIYLGGQDCTSIDNVVENTGDSNLVLGSSSYGAGVFCIGGHFTYAGAGKDGSPGEPSLDGLVGNNRTASIEVLGSSGAITGAYCDKPARYGIYLNANHSMITATRVYQSNNNTYSAAGGYADVYVSGDSMYNKFNNMYLCGTAHPEADWAIDDDNGGSYNYYAQIEAFGTYTIGGISMTGTGSHCGQSWNMTVYVVHT